MNAAQNKPYQKHAVAGLVPAIHVSHLHGR